MSVYNFVPKKNGSSIYVQLKQALVNDINLGIFENMEKLPSRRTLSNRLGVSTTTVNNAYQALVDEGYAMTIDRSGFYVKSNDIQSSDYNDVTWEHEQNYVYNFSYNDCDISNLNDTFLKSIEKNIIDNDKKALFRHGNKRGEVEFRAAISRHLLKHRLIDAPICDIFLGAGMAYLITVITMILGTNKVYGFENPTDYKIYVWIKNLGLNIKLVDIDINGEFSVDELDRLGIDVMFVMPENQLPTGQYMSKKMRRELTQWCSGKTSEKYVVEIATDGNLQYDINKESPIYTISDRNNVIYMESLEYTVSPNTKTSFMLLPKGLINSAIKKLEAYSPLVTIPEQLAYKEIINKGLLSRLIKRNNNTMLEKRDFLIKSLKLSKLNGKINIYNKETGMNFLGHLNSTCSGIELSKIALQHDVKIFDMSKFLLKPNNIITQNSFVFGYAGLSIPEIEKAVKNLEKAWIGKI